MKNTIVFKAPSNSAIFKSVLYSTLEIKKQKNCYSVDFSGVGKETLTSIIKRNGGEIIAK
jgi:hypothetical protein